MIWGDYMTLRELYAEAIKGNYQWLSVLIEFLVFEKKTLSFNSNISELDLYFKPNNRTRMNKLLLEYRASIEKSA